MKHVLTALGLIALVLSFCIFAAAGTRKVCQEALELLQTASDAVRQKDFSGAEQALKKAAGLWRTRESFFGVVLSHAETDEILTRFAALEEYVRLQDRDDFLSICAELEEAIRHLAEMELPKLHNIL